MLNVLIQGAHAILRMGKASALGKWGWKLFARKGSCNVAVPAIARKLVVQVWHLLGGNPPTGLESDKSFTIKLEKLAVVPDKEVRENLGLGKGLIESIQELRKRTQEACPSPPVELIPEPA